MFIIVIKSIFIAVFPTKLRNGFLHFRVLWSIVGILRIVPGKEFIVVVKTIAITIHKTIVITIHPGGPLFFNLFLLLIGN